MRKLTLILLAWLCLALSQMKAQSNSSGLETQITNALSQLDTKPIQQSTGIWLDRVPQYIPIKRYKGTSITDSTHILHSSYLMAYRMMDICHISPSTMYPSDSIDHRISTYKSAPIVYLGAMAYQYDRFKSTAMTDGLISFDGTYFIQTSNTGSPYQLDTMVMATVMRASYDSLTVPYYLPSDFFSSNLVASTDMDIDYGDGLGYRPVQYDTFTDIKYEAAGVYTITFRYRMSDHSYRYATTQITVSDGGTTTGNDDGSSHAQRGGGGFNNRPDGSHIIGTSAPGIQWVRNEDGELVSIPITVPTSGIQVFYWLNKQCDESKIRKPLIISDGFDPGNARGSSFVMDGTNGLLDQKYGLDKFLKDLIHDEGYDIFFVNYIDGTGDIPTNALYLKQTIEWINAQKHAAGSSEKNIYIGPSMGGVIGKWMFQEFENLGQDHECELFISYDSPLRGANIPLALQSLPLRLGNREILGNPLWKQDKTGVIKSGQEALLSPAAKQLLYYHLGLVDNNITTVSPEMLDDWHDQFYAALDSRGELEIPHIAISNGSLNGEQQLYNMGQEIQNFIQEDNLPEIVNTIGSVATIFFPSLRSLGILLSTAELDITMQGKAMAPFGLEIHKNSVKTTTLGITFSDSETLTTTDGFFPYDNSPGGMTVFNKTGSNGEISYDNGWKFASFCFIPTISALDLRNVTDPFASGLTAIDAIQTTNAPQIRTYIGSTSTSIQYGSVQGNQEHVSFNSQLATFVLGNIKKHELSGELTNRTFNFGKAKYSASYPNGTITTTSHTIKKNLTISNTGKLWVNRNDKIAFTDQPNFINVKPSYFDVSISADCSTPSTVDVKDGGQISVGDIFVNNIGEFKIADKNRLLISSGGTVTVDDKSSISVQKDGILEILSGGTLIIKGDGFIDVQKGGNLVVEPGAKIILEKALTFSGAYHRGSRILLSGNLNLQGGEITISGKGYMAFELTHRITSSTSNVKFGGHGKEFPSYFVNSKVEIVNYNFITDNAYFQLQNELIHNSNGQRLVSTRNSKFVNPNLAVVNVDQTIIIDSRLNFSIIKSSSVSLSNTEFSDVMCKIENCPIVTGNGVEAIVYNKPSCFILKDVNKAVFTRSQFSSDNPKFYGGVFAPITPVEVYKIGLDLEKVTELRLNLSEISGFNKENGLRTGLPLLDHIGIRAKESGYIYMNNAKILDCKYGIYAKDAFNLIMDKSEIGYSTAAGIYMTGSSTTGLVKMICSSLHDCVNGILGTDITLAIDGLINSQTKGYTPGNEFLNNKYHFSINYERKEVPYIIYARYNTWTKPELYHLPASVYLDQSQQGLATCLGVKPDDTKDCDALPPQFPIQIDGVQEDLYLGFCPEDGTCTGQDIMESYWRAYTCFYKDNLATAVETLLPLGLDHYAGDNDDMRAYCKAMLAEANAFAGGLYEYNDEMGAYGLDVDATCGDIIDGVQTKVLTFSSPNASNMSAQRIVWRTQEPGRILGPDNGTSITTNGQGTYALHVLSTNGCKYSEMIAVDSILLDCNLDTTIVTGDTLVYLTGPDYEDYQQVDSIVAHVVSNTPINPDTYVWEVHVSNEGADGWVYNTTTSDSIILDSVIWENSFDESTGAFWGCNIDSIRVKIFKNSAYIGQASKVYVTACIRPEIDQKDDELLLSNSNDIIYNDAKIHPNPFSRDIMLSWNVGQSGDGTIDVLDGLGRKIISKTVVLSRGNNSMNLDDMSDLPNGIYTFRLSQGTQNKTLRAIKTN